MSLLGLSLAYIRARSLNAALNLVLLGLGIGTIVLLILFSAQLEERLRRATVVDERAQFLPGDAQALPVSDGSKDMMVSGLVLNFVPDREKALAEMKRAARAGATVAFYGWDYPGGGVEFLQAFWTAAIALDPDAQDLAEDRRFAFCTSAGLTGLAEAAGL